MQILTFITTVGTRTPAPVLLSRPTQQHAGIFALACRLYLGTVYMPKILPKFSDSPSHRIFERMHEALNIDKK
jgi:hypothetical protein